MKTQMNHVTGGMVLAALAGLASHVRASIPQEDMVREAFMEFLGHDTTFVGRYFGGDEFSPLHVVSSVDTNAMTFSYQTAPGQTYQGQPVSLNAAGAYDAGNDVWNWSSNGSLGGFAWTNAGTGHIFDAGLNLAGGQFDTNVFAPMSPVESGLFGFDLHTSIRYENSTVYTKSTLSMQFTFNGIPIGPKVTGTDIITAGGTQWRWNIGTTTGNRGAFNIDSGGGYSSSTVRIVPTPGAAALASAGVLFTLVRRRRPVIGD